MGSNYYWRVVSRWMDFGGDGGVRCRCRAVSLLLLASAALVVASDEAAAMETSGDTVSGVENLPWPTWDASLLRMMSAPSPTAAGPDARFPLALAAKRTKRPDVLDKFRMYRGGWDITNKHYWASVAFTGLAGFLLAVLWLLSFGLALGMRLCCGWGALIKYEGSFCCNAHRKRRPFYKRWACPMLTLVFICAALTGCILLFVGQAEFCGEGLDTLNFVVNQSDITVQILWNVTDFLAFAKTINIHGVCLPSTAQDDIDKLNADVSDAANTLSEKTGESSGKIRGGIDYVHWLLIIVACLMLLLLVLGSAFSIFRPNHAIYIFIITGWLFVVLTFILYGAFQVLSNATGDTCAAMGEWIQYPQAETSLSNLLPCVDEQTTNRTLYQSKEVTFQLVNIVNTAIFSIANVDVLSLENIPYFYKQSGPKVPYLCSPYDSQLHDRQCGYEEVTFANASAVWENYTCKVSDSGSCVSPGRLTPEIYNQLVMAVNVSYALGHYTPLLLNLRNCKFVRETFNGIIALYCPRLENDLRLVSAALALISVGILLCLTSWTLRADHPRKRVRIWAAA